MHIVSRVGIGKVPPSNPLYLDVGGAVNFDSTLQVIGQTTVNALISSQLASNTLVYESRIVGETNVLFSINRDGKIEWGEGGLSFTDVNFYRSAVGMLRTNGSITIDNSLIVGNATSDTATFTARIASSLDPSATNSYSLGQDILRWQNLWLSVKLTSVDGLFTGNLQVDNNTTLGSSSSDTLTVNAFVASPLTPSITNTHNLGSATNKWASLWLGTDLQVDGNTILGDSPSDTVTVNAGFASSMNPSVDNTYDIGTISFRWRTLNAGPAGVVIRNDTTDTQKVSLYFSSDVSYLTSSSSVKLVLSTGTNNGIYVDTSGKVGINYSNSTSLTNIFNVSGTSIFTDTAQFSKPIGYGLKVTSVAGIEGSIESANTEKQLNIGINSETEFINLGTGALTKTINIGTGLGKTTINIGGSSDIININGTVTTTQTIESFVSDKTFALNVGGLNNTSQNSGLVIEEASATFLSISNPTFQSKNIVRYYTTDTGNIKIGSVVLISGFSNLENNGQFTVTAISTNLFFDIQNAQIFDASFNEVNLGFCTNPTISSSILITPDRSGWDFISPLNNLNYFRLSNLGANAEFKSTIDGISVVSTAFIPESANTPLGSSTKPWNGYLNHLTIYGNSIIGDVSTDTLTINAITSFTANVDSDIIPNSGKNLGSSLNSWNYIYSNNLDVNNFAELTGSIYLGTDNTTSIYMYGSIATNLIPITNNLTIGNLVSPWDHIYINSINISNLSPGSILFINSLNEISQINSKLFWDEINNRLYLGQNTGSYILDIANTIADSIRLRNITDSSAIALRANTTSAKIEYTNIIQFGSNTYANVGDGSSTPVLELTSNAIKLLGAVSVNSVSTSAATYTVQPTDVIVNVNTAVSGCTITLPSAATKRLLVIKDIGNNASAANRAIQLAPALNQYVEFNAINTAYVIDRDGESVTLQSDGTSRWYII